MATSKEFTVLIDPARTEKTRVHTRISREENGRGPLET
jgi:hypothetical protein